MAKEAIRDEMGVKHDFGVSRVVVSYFKYVIVQTHIITDLYRYRKLKLPLVH